VYTTETYSCSIKGAIGYTKGYVHGDHSGRLGADAVVDFFSNYSECNLLKSANASGSANIGTAGDISVTIIIALPSIGTSYYLVHIILSKAGDANCKASYISKSSSEFSGAYSYQESDASMMPLIYFNGGDTSKTLQGILITSP